MDPLVRTAFPAMGSTVAVVLDGPDTLLPLARRRIEDLEQKWSRFRADSEVSGLNRADGPLAVSSDTQLLLRCGVLAWRATAGAFDPTLHDALVRWGYDRDLAEARGPAVPPAPEPAPGLGSVEVDDAAGTASLGGVRFDPGGIGKGLAADLVAIELIVAGATGALVSVGGDTRVAGTPPPGGWAVALEDPGSPASDLCRIGLAGGGLATSSPRRRWPAATGTAHHLFDPRTGQPAETTLSGVTVLAGEAWWAEALTKAVLVGGVPPEGLTSLGASGIGRTWSGAVVGTDDLLAIVTEAA